MWNEARGLEVLFVLRIAPKFGERWSRTTSHIWEHVACVLSRFELDLAAVVMLYRLPNKTMHSIYILCALIMSFLYNANPDFMLSCLVVALSSHIEAWDCCCVTAAS